MANNDDIDELVFYLIAKDLEEAEAAARNQNTRRAEAGNTIPDTAGRESQLNSSLDTCRSVSTGSFSGEPRVASSPATSSSIQCYGSNLDISASDSLAGAGQSIDEISEQNIGNSFRVPVETTRSAFSKKDEVQSNTYDTSPKKHNVGLSDWRSAPQKRPRSTSLGADEGNCRKKGKKTADLLPQGSPAAADSVAGPSGIQRQTDETEKKQPFPCDVCDKAFAYRSDFEIHYRKHTGEKPFNCPHCDQRFTQKITLTAHIRTHTGERPFECEVCGKKFALKASLMDHLHTHTGEKPHKCQFCGRGFARRVDCKRHEKNKSCRK